MNWLQVLAICCSTIFACLWVHRKSSGLWRENTRELRDFQRRLCDLEEQYLRIAERILEKK